MKLPERLALRTGRGFHSTIVTSFGVEFAAVEEILVPQLAASGTTNILILADDRMSGLALSDGASLPTFLGQSYILQGCSVSTGVFHPKIILQLGRDGGRVFVSSANATAAGLAGNLEISTEIKCSTEASPEQLFVKRVWKYLSHITTDMTGAARDAINWAKERTPWLLGDATEEIQTLGDSSLLGFLGSPDDTGILERFTNLLKSVEIERLIILSPFWDKDLSALSELQKLIAPKKTSVLLDPLTHEFPVDAAKGMGLEVIDISEWQGGRYKHAKLIIASSSEHDHVLSGSANCTIAAMGRAGFRGTNAEASVYTRLKKGECVNLLRLDEILEKSSTPLEELNCPIPQAEIPLDKAAKQNPGYFEINHNVLYWMPLSTSQWGTADIAIFAADGPELDRITADKCTQLESKIVVPCRPDDLVEARFAQLIEQSRSSLLAPIMNREVLRNQRREPVSGRTGKSAGIFDSANGMELFLLEAFEDLYRADVEDPADLTHISKTRDISKSSKEPPPDDRKLTYEEFMEERSRPISGNNVGGNSLAGMHCDGVRTLLNRLLGDGPIPQNTPDDDWSNLGDEEGELENGNDESSDSENAEVEAVLRPVDGKAFERVVKDYVDRVKHDDRPIIALDVVRLRLLVMTILWNAKCDLLPEGLGNSTSEQDWPRLALRSIAAFFHGKNAPIRRLILSRDFEQMPADFLECWITVIWTLDVIPKILGTNRSNADFLSHFPMLRKGIIKQVGLTEADLNSEIANHRITSLNCAIGERLGLLIEEATLPV